MYGLLISYQIVRYPQIFILLKMQDENAQKPQQSSYSSQDLIMPTQSAIYFTLDKDQQNLYYKTKNNATIELLIKVLEGYGSLGNNQDIMSFVDHQHITDIGWNQVFYLGCQPQHSNHQQGNSGEQVQNLNHSQWAYHSLNPSQIQAIDLVIRSKISFIKGPPGCGKTKTIAKLAIIFTFFGYPMLIGAVSNTANMTILQAILNQSYELSYMPNIVLYINKQSHKQNMELREDIRCLTFRWKVVSAYLEEVNSREWVMNREHVDHLVDKFYNRDDVPKNFLSLYYKAMAKVFQQANIVIITTTSSAKFDLKLTQQQRFRPFIGILDEAAQASWADAYCFLIKGVQKIVFLGDQKQLTPTVISQNQILKQAIFTTLSQKNPAYFALLDTQYRMHPKIAEFPNIFFYKNQLKNGVTAEERMSDLQYFKKYPVSFVDCQTQETELVCQISRKKSYYNEKEAEIIVRLLSMFSVEQYNKVGIISPYDLQIRVIQYHISKYLQKSQKYEGHQLPQIQVKTCDGYQGCQKQYIIVSCVRANKEGKIGFCGEENRLNVTLTRARRGIILIGNAATLGMNVESDEGANDPDGIVDEEVQEEGGQVSITTIRDNDNSNNRLDNNGLFETKKANVWRQYLKYLQQNKLIVKEQEVNKYIGRDVKQNTNQISIFNNSEHNLMLQQVSQTLLYNNHRKNINEGKNGHKKSTQSLKSSISLQVVTVKQEQQNYQYLKQMKQFKKSIKAAFNKLSKIINKKNTQKQLQQCKVQLQSLITGQKKYQQLKNDLKQEQKGPRIHISTNLIKKYRSLTNPIPKQSDPDQHEQVGHQTLQTYTQKLYSDILTQIQDQYNHIIYNRIVDQSVDCMIMWILYRFGIKLDGSKY